MEFKTIVIVAGEASGDLHASHLVHALARRIDRPFICGMGASAMHAAGVKVLVDAHQTAVVGITEALAKAPRVLSAMSRLKRLLAGLRPDLLILIDFPDFNLHLAKSAKKLGIPVLYYISPQIWAWRSGRVRKIKNRVDHMAVILPFEKQFYERHQVPVTFVGHPLMDALYEHIPVRSATLPKNSQPVVCLVPGSRDREVNRLLPLMLEAARCLSLRMPQVRFVISCASSIDEVLIKTLLKQHVLENATISKAPVCELFLESSFAVVASGTVTLEAAICGTPMTVVYAVSPLSYWMGRALINVAHIGLVNLIAEARIVPELIQKAATPQAVCDEIHNVLSDPERYAALCRQLLDVRQRLGQPGASDKVADIACRLMEQKHVV